MGACEPAAPGVAAACRRPRRCVQFQLTINIAAVAMAVGGVLAVGESPLTPVQMLWVNMIMDSLASVALATEAPSDAMLRLRPFSSSTPLLTPSCVKHICGQVRPPPRLRSHLHASPHPVATRQPQPLMGHGTPPRLRCFRAAVPVPAE